MTTTESFRITALREAARQSHPDDDSTPVHLREQRVARRRGFAEGAEWARAHLAAQEPTDAEVEAAAQAIDPDAWGRDSDGESQREHARDGARAALTAARNAGRAEG